MFDHTAGIPDPEHYTTGTQSDGRQRALKVGRSQTKTACRYGHEVIRSSDRFTSSFFRMGLFTLTLSGTILSC
ncbi:hypothetical protein CROQUDRAFT_88000 [Cronartium quercuum f. sp. fusiforme G11]|uniref:Uncharacterized protein n=1 Tax=Cronartium quercuum f. sp. fusiforme G11 TaxID=708437 RepID=A0A9P6TFC1_9BASI|nr:hypothetical protein CROQUDRAFT_88000 [Cronartium quercuum f. sp. fusiforme G11]